MNESKLEVIQISVDQLSQFKYHIFKPYDEKRMNTLLTSVKENGIIHPIVTRRIKDKDGKEQFEIISGHNRVEAAKSAGLKEVPAVVKDLTDDEAVLLANEANIESRHFKNWLQSERIKSINQCQDAIKKQGAKKTPSPSSGDNPQKSDDYARERTATVYGQSVSIIRLYTELNKLIEPLQDKLDKEEFGTTPASELSFIHSEGQKLVNSVLDEKDKDGKKVYTINVKNSKGLRKHFYDCVNETRIKKEGELIKNEIRKILTNVKESPTPDAKSDDTVKLPISKEKYDELFPDNSPEEAVDEVIKLVMIERAKTIS